MFKLPHLRNSIVCDGKLSKSLDDSSFRKNLHADFLKSIADIREWVEGPPEESDDEESEYSNNFRDIARRFSRKRTSVASLFSVRSNRSRFSTRSVAKSNKSLKVTKQQQQRSNKMKDQKRKNKNKNANKQKKETPRSNAKSQQRKGTTKSKSGIKLPELVKGGKTPREMKWTGKMTPTSDTIGDSSGRQSLFPHEKMRYTFRWSVAVDLFRKRSDPVWMRKPVRPDSSDIRDLVMGLQFFQLDGGYDAPSSSLWAEQEDDLASMIEFPDINRRLLGLRSTSRMSSRAGTGTDSAFLTPSRAGSRIDTSFNTHRGSARGLDYRSDTLRSIDFGERPRTGRLNLIPENERPKSPRLPQLQLNDSPSM